MAETESGSLASRTCIPCRGGVPTLPEDVILMFLRELDDQWRVVEGKRLEREFRFKNFRQSMAFAQVIGAIAEEQKHHPDLCVGWGYVRVALSTHAIGGLHENDFILAARIDRVPLE